MIIDYTNRDFLLFTRELEEKVDGEPGKQKVKRKVRKEEEEEREKEKKDERRKKRKGK